MQTALESGSLCLVLSFLCGPASASLVSAPVFELGLTWELTLVQAQILTNNSTMPQNSLSGFQQKGLIGPVISTGRPDWLSDFNRRAWLAQRLQQQDQMGSAFQLPSESPPPLILRSLCVFLPFNQQALFTFHILVTPSSVHYFPITHPGNIYPCGILLNLSIGWRVHDLNAETPCPPYPPVP